ncbi:MAG: phosphatase PAP2 family protein [Pseudomonadota bacterium]
MHDLISRADVAELNLCLRLHGLSEREAINRLFGVVSRLGDGVLWYTLMAIIALAGGVAASVAMLHIGLTALVGVMIYSQLKSRLVRQRPFISHDRITCRKAPLDQYSFPSGHTLHAVLFTTMFFHYVPVLGLVVLPFALLVALSRVVLGLHYPSDVIVGAILGAVLAILSLQGFAMPVVEFPASFAGWTQAWV